MIKLRYSDQEHNIILSLLIWISNLSPSAYSDPPVFYIFGKFPPPTIWTPRLLGTKEYTLFYKNVEAEICRKFKNVLWIFEGSYSNQHRNMCLYLHE